MSTKPCDQFGSDLFDAAKSVEAETGILCAPSSMTLESMVGDVEEMYRVGSPFDRMLDSILDMYGLEMAAERSCYKRALGKVFGRRAAYKASQNRVRSRYVELAAA